MPCEASENQAAIDQSKFWDSDGIHWEPHRIGWTVAGACAFVTVIISMISVLQHCRNYTNPRQQRQILRILYMPPVYAIISFLSYRFFRYYTYYSFVYIAYEAITLSAFLMLIIEYVAATATGNSADKAIERKDKRPLPIPFCCWRYRPTKAYFMYTVKWSVLQYVIVRPVASIVGIVCEHYKILCATEGFDFHYASVYIEIVNFVSISIALYGLLVFYGLMAEELKGKRPVAKFLSIKLIVMFTFYQTFMFHALEGRVIKATTYWTTTNIANGLNALAICIEMVFFAILMWWAYTPKEYTRKEGTRATSVWRPILDSINYMDFLREIAHSFRFFFSSKSRNTARHVPIPPDPSSPSPYTSTFPPPPGAGEGKTRKRMSFGEAFGVDHPVHPHGHAQEYAMQPQMEMSGRKSLAKSVESGGKSVEGEGGGVYVREVGYAQRGQYRSQNVQQQPSGYPPSQMQPQKQTQQVLYQQQQQRHPQQQINAYTQQPYPPPQPAPHPYSYPHSQNSNPPPPHPPAPPPPSTYDYATPPNQPIPRTLRPHQQQQQDERPESEVDLGYYQSAYSGVDTGSGERPDSFVGWTGGRAV